MQTQDTIERIRALAAQGYTRGEIGIALGLTRSTVIGIMWRMAHPDYSKKREATRVRSGRGPGRPTTIETTMRLEPHIYKLTKTVPIVLPAMRPRLDPKPRVGRPPLATCCWHGCSAPPVERGKPYCDRHSRA